MPTKEQFEQTILDINGSTCDQFKKMVTLSKLISEVYGEIYNDDGDLDPDGAFLQAVCANLDCDGNGPGGGTTTTTGSTTTPVPAPGSVTDLVAADQWGYDLNDFQYLTFTKPSGATQVSLYRSTTASSGDADLVMDRADITDFDDHSTFSSIRRAVTRPDGKVLLLGDPDIGSFSNSQYYYWVKTHSSASNSSGFSNPSAQVRRLKTDAGYTNAAYSGWNFGNSTQWTPGVVSRVYFKLVAGGGAGAGGSTTAGGGGGGAGGTVVGYVDVTHVNDSIRIDLGTSTGTTANSTNGVSGNDAVLYMTPNGGVEAEIMRATAGGGGVYDAAGGGSGGAGGGGTNASASGYVAYTGGDGAAESSGKGGYPGYSELYVPLPNLPIGSGDNPAGATWSPPYAGGGSDLADSPSWVPFATGGANQGAKAFYYWAW